MEYLRNVTPEGYKCAHVICIMRPNYLEKYKKSYSNNVIDTFFHHGMWPTDRPDLCPVDYRVRVRTVHRSGRVAAAAG